MLWEGLVRWQQYPTFILPSPGLVAHKLVVVIVDGSLWYHTQITLWENVAGLALGLSAATVLGYLLAKSHRLERLLSPYLVASQAIPIIAIAPLLIIWISSPSVSKVLISALTIFFPTFMTRSSASIGRTRPACADAVASCQPLANPDQAGNASHASECCSEG